MDDPACPDNRQQRKGQQGGKAGVLEGNVQRFGGGESHGGAENKDGK